MIHTQLGDLSQPSSAKALISLLDAYAQSPMGGGEPLAEYTRNNLVEALDQHQGCSIIFAFNEEQAVGLCICFDAFSTFASRPILNIHDVYVDTNYRGQGIAGQMLKLAEKIARDKGCCKITLEVLEKNNAAKSAYRNTGFQPYHLDERFGQAEFWQKSLL